jgi:predicted RNA-binding Zn-ribbon protein involved in translation (DUF1610 family)
VDEATNGGGAGCPECGVATEAGAARCASCGAGVEPATAAASPPRGGDAGERDDFDDRRSRERPRCPNCGTRMEIGAVQIRQKVLDVIFTGLSAHALFFYPKDGKRRQILKAGQRRRAMLCPICGGLWMR